jgi:hypothetical protein
MSVPRVLLILSLSLSFAALPLAAQSSSDINLLASTPQTGSLTNPFRDAPADPFRLRINPQIGTTPTNPFSALSSDSSTNVVLGSPRKVEIVDAQGEITCLSMRTYRVKRDRPQSDATVPAGYSTCTPSKRFDVKSAVEKSGAVLH